MKRLLFGVVLAMGLGVGYGQPKGAPPVPAVITQDQMADTQQALLKLLRMSPMLTEVVERDPSLLADQSYVSRTNPQLADFLTAHPEVARNPEFYLFNGIEGRAGHRHESLDRKIWPELSVREDSVGTRLVSNAIIPFLVFLCILAAVIWLVKVFVENRRWSRTIKLQVDAHSRLIERFSSNQELLVYMQTEAGRKFLEAGPVPVDFEPSQKIPSAVGRVLTPLQIGTVMSLLGAGFLMLRNSVHEARVGLLVAGVVVLMPGLGFILSAGLTWLLAGRLGMLPADTTRDRM